MRNIVTSRVFVSAVVVLLGIIILFVSLFTTSKTIEFRMNMSPNDQRPLRELFTRNILPGTPLYPFAVFKDWVVLFFSQTDQERVIRMMEYADKRLSNALILSEMGSNEHITSSSPKSQLYLGRATELCRENISLQECTRLLAVLEEHAEKLRGLRNSLNDSDRSQIDASLHYNEVLNMTLSGLLQKAN